MSLWHMWGNIILAQHVKMRPWRLPLAQQKAADRELEELLNGSIIEPSNSLWASAVVMVPKMNNPRIWFWEDYRPVNKVTSQDSYLLSRIDKSLDLVGVEGCGNLRSSDLGITML